MYKKNLSLFLERFPKLGLLAPTWPLTEEVTESIGDIDLSKVEALYIYGLGQGASYFSVCAWLKENPDRQLIFLEDEPGHIASFLYTRQAKKILSDPQVHLELISKRGEELRSLAQQFPFDHFEVLALPSRKKGRFPSVRLQLLRQTTLSQALHLDRLYGHQLFEHFLQNLRHLPASFYANRLKDRFQGIPAVVCGAGPSLQQALPHLRELEERALLIGGGSTLAALSAEGILPHFGMAVDPNPEEFERLKNSFTFEMPLLYSTRVFPAVFQAMNGPFGYLRSGIGGALELWLEEALGLLDPLVGTHLPVESLSVTEMCIAWAQFLGCRPIFLSGVDLAYTKNKRYAPGVSENSEISLNLIDSEKKASDRILKRRDREGKSIATAVRWIIEAKNISHFAKKHPEVPFFNTTEEGLPLKGIPFIPLKKVKERYLQRTWHLRRLVWEEISASHMPLNTKEVIDRKMEELKISLDQIISHLEILSEKKPGSKALAEYELGEESPLLFYDIPSVLNRALARRFRPWPKQKEEERALAKWKLFCDLATNYRQFLL